MNEVMNQQREPVDADVYEDLVLHRFLYSAFYRLAEDPQDSAHCMQLAKQLAQECGAPAVSDLAMELVSVARQLCKTLRSYEGGGFQCAANLCCYAEDLGKGAHLKSVWLNDDHLQRRLQWAMRRIRSNQDG